MWEGYSRNPMNATNRGFTLVELLLVISIISLLSSIIMSSVTVARGKAQDAAVKRHLSEMRTLMGNELSDTGSYTNLKVGGSDKNPGGTCAVGAGPTQLKGTYATNFKTICDSLIKTYNTSCTHDGTAGGVCLNFRSPVLTALTPQNASKFSMYAFLPNASKEATQNMVLCMGSNGRSSVSAASTLSGPGCPNDPDL